MGVKVNFADESLHRHRFFWLLRCKNKSHQWKVLENLVQKIVWFVMLWPKLLNISYWFFLADSVLFTNFNSFILRNFIQNLTNHFLDQFFQLLPLELFTFTFEKLEIRRIWYMKGFIEQIFWENQISLWEIMWKSRFEMF